ncbi:MAG: TonB family protein [Verrucomicrobiota bacterium]
MRLAKNQPFWTSVILHAVILFFLFLGTIVEAFRPKEKEHVFVMVDMADAPVDEAAQAEEPTPRLDLPQIEELPDIPEPVVPPEPMPQPPEPTPTPPAPSPAREIVNFDDFRQEHTIPEPKPRQPQPQRNFEAPTIQVPGELDRLLENQPNPQRAQVMTPAQQTALQRYGAQLNARLNGAWRKPASLTGVQLRASVVFDVSASGRMTNIRLKPSSGNAAFDQSVIAAFRAIASAGPTPTAQSHTFTMDFRMVE